MIFTENDRKTIKELLSCNSALKNINQKHKNAVPIVDIETISNEVWLFLRALIGLGGSEVAGLLGLSPYSNPIKIFDNKFNYLYRQPYIGMTDDEIETVIKRLESNNPEKSFNYQYMLDFGHYMEDFIKDQFLKAFDDKYKDDFEDAFSKQYGKYMEITNVEVYKDSYLYKDPTAPLFADFDYRIRISFADGTVEEGIFECKTSDTYQIGKKWDNGFPEYYNCQTRHYMAIANVNFFVICCVADNNANNFYTHLGFRDMKFENNLLSKVNEFWFDHVVKEEQPKVDNDIDALDDLLDSINTSSLNDTPNKLGLIALNLLQKRDSLLDNKKTYQSAIKNIESEVAKIETQLCQKCAEHKISEVESDEDKYVITITSQSRNTFDKKAFLKAFPEQQKNVDDYTTTTTSTKLKIKKFKKEN